MLSWSKFKKSMYDFSFEATYCINITTFLYLSLLPSPSTVFHYLLLPTSNLPFSEPDKEIVSRFERSGPESIARSGPNVPKQNNSKKVFGMQGKGPIQLDSEAHKKRKGWNPAGCFISSIRSHFFILAPRSRENSMAVTMMERLNAGAYQEITKGLHNALCCRNLQTKSGTTILRKIGPATQK